jgi:hypothetical protein
MHGFRDERRAMSSGLFPARKPTGSWWRDHSLSLVIGAMLLLQTAWVLYTGHSEWISQQIDHGASSPFGWPWEFWQWWSFEFINSLVADTYGVLLIVLLTKWFYERGSDE